MKKTLKILNLFPIVCVLMFCSCTFKTTQSQFGVPLSRKSVIKTGYTNLDKALAFLSKCDLSKYANGKHEIDGKNIFMTFSDDTLRDEKSAELEAHRKYIDIQIILDGTEKMGIRDTETCKTISVPYNEEKDILFFKDTPTNYIELQKDQMVIFLPSNAHMPLLGSGKVHKCVVKVLAD